MSQAVSPGRGEDARYRRFGMLLGIGAAIVLHLALFLIPSQEEKAEPLTQRGFKAKAFRNPGAAPAAPRPPTAARPGAPPPTSASDTSQPPLSAPVAPAPLPLSGAQVERQASGALDASGPSSSQGGLDSGLGVGDGQAALGTGSAGAGAGAGTGVASAGGHGSIAGHGSGGADTEETRRGAAWSNVLAELEQTQKAQGQGGARQWTGAQAKVAARQEVQEPVTGNDVMDARIRVQVVSYPPTSIEGYRARIPYPRAKTLRKELIQGTCRVYLRLWTDAAGNVVKEQLKSPSSEEERKLYADYINAVRRAVQDWPFDTVPAEVHVDVLFELREAD